MDEYSPNSVLEAEVLEVLGPSHVFPVCTSPFRPDRHWNRPGEYRDSESDDPTLYSRHLDTHPPLETWERTLPPTHSRPVSPVGWWIRKGLGDFRLHRSRRTTGPKFGQERVLDPVTGRVRGYITFHSTSLFPVSSDPTGTRFLRPPSVLSPVEVLPDSYESDPTS